MRTFSLKDDTCFSGIRIHPNDREVDGGGYINLTAPPVPSASRGRLIPAHGFIPVPAVGSAPFPERSRRAGEIAVPCETNLTDGERAAMREMVGKIERANDVNSRR